MNFVNFVSAHTGNEVLDNTITKYDWTIGLGIRIVLFVMFILLIKYLMKKWQKK
jgi:hypothetical protein